MTNTIIIKKKYDQQYAIILTMFIIITAIKNKFIADFETGYLFLWLVKQINKQNQIIISKMYLENFLIPLIIFIWKWEEEENEDEWRNNINNNTLKLGYSFFNTENLLVTCWSGYIILILIHLLNIFN